MLLSPLVLTTVKRYFQFDLRKRVLQKLQFVLNAAARQWKDLFVCPENMIKFRRFFKIDLYWLPVKELMNFKILLLTYKP